MEEKTNKKRKVLKGVLIAVICIVVLVALAAILVFFPLKGEKHVEVWSADQEFDINKIQTVEMEGDELKILVFADTQLWSEPGVNKKCYEEMDKLVEQTKPDMIVTVGDNLSAMEARFGIKKYVNKIESYGIPWAPVYGNHDNEMPCNTLNWQTDQYMKAPHCMMQKGPSNLYGCGNYVINIVKDGSPVYTMFMIDNGRYIDYGEGIGTKEIYMPYEQIAWYKWNVLGIKEANGGEVVPSMTFSHFAQPEFRENIEKKFDLEKDENGNVTKITIPEGMGDGYIMYLPGCAPVKSGFVDTCNELGSTKYFFCGHDHENYGSVTDDNGNVYTYALKTGPSPTPWNNALYTGGTVITVDKNSNVDIDHVIINDRSAEFGN